MIMKTITLMPESQRRAAMARIKRLVEAGHTVDEISKELNIPESEIRECIEWVNTYGTMLNRT